LGFKVGFADIIKKYSVVKTIKNKDINMKTHKTAIITVTIVGLGIVFFGWLASANAERVSTSREYEVVVPEAQSDTQRVIAAYERLSDQFLSLVQSQLVQMATNNRDVAARLERMEKKLDDLSAKIDAMQKPAAEPIPPKSTAAPAEVKTAKPAVPEPRTGKPVPVAK
jgi:predicted negative regulator of RcsB-dependent stress response